MGIWISFVGAGLNGYLGGLMMEASCLMMVVEWVDDRGWLLDDGSWMDCVGSVKEMIVYKNEYFIE